MNDDDNDDESKCIEEHDKKNYYRYNTFGGLCMASFLHWHTNVDNILEKQGGNIRLFFSKEIISETQQKMKWSPACFDRVRPLCFFHRSSFCV